VADHGGGRALVMREIAQVWKGQHDKDVSTSIRVLEQNDPVWRNKQTVEHTGNIGILAALLSKDEIKHLSNEDLQKMRSVRKIELAALKAEVDTGADDVRGDETTSDRTS
jgi:hypothetical protein